MLLLLSWHRLIIVGYRKCHKIPTFFSQKTLFLEQEFLLLTVVFMNDFILNISEIIFVSFGVFSCDIEKGTHTNTKSVTYFQLPDRPIIMHRNSAHFGQCFAPWFMARSNIENAIKIAYSNSRAVEIKMSPHLLCNRYYVLSKFLLLCLRKPLYPLTTTTAKLFQLNSKLTLKRRWP